jgi:hypothetical protein
MNKLSFMKLTRPRVRGVEVDLREFLGQSLAEAL